MSNVIEIELSKKRPMINERKMAFKGLINDVAVAD